MRFRFVESGTGQGARTDLSQATLRLSRSRLSLGGQVYQKLGEPQRLRVAHDVAAKAIRLTPSSHSLEGYAVQFRPDSKKPYLKTTKPQEFLPLGEYLPISNNIFVHESVQR